MRHALIDSLFSRTGRNPADDTRVRPSAPDYTNAALIMGLVNLLWIFFALWAVWGLPAVLAAGYLVYLGIDWIAARRR